MAVTDQTLMNEVQYHLMETPNNGASYSSGLYTVAEVVGRFNFRADLFNKLTGAYTLQGSQTAVSGAKLQDISTAAPSFIDIMSAFWSSDAGTTYSSLPNGSSFEADTYISNQAAVATPLLWALDTSAVTGITLIPAPTFSGSNGKIKLLYLPKLGLFPASPNGTALQIPDDFTPFIKYGALADLFGKSGETYDPVRSAICESLFQLGVEVTIGWLTGSEAPATPIPNPRIART